MGYKGLAVLVNNLPSPLETYLCNFIVSQPKMTIKAIKASYVYDSRGNPTVEVNLTTEHGSFRSIAPSGASTGVHEAVELRDKDSSLWGGQGVTKAVKAVNEVIAPKLIDAKIAESNQTAIDDFMIKLDGTEHKSNLGANAIVAVSMAVCRAGAASKGVPLYQHIAELADLPTEKFVIPVPFFNILNGGAHAGGSLPFQEFLVAPIGAESFEEALRIGTEIYHSLKALAVKKYGPSAGNVGDEGGVAPDIETAEDALDLITEAIKATKNDDKVRIGMDAAPSAFSKTVDNSCQYNLNFKRTGCDPNWLNGKQMSQLYNGLVEKYQFVSLEDPFAEDDWESWSKYYGAFDHSKIQVIADDLTCTNQIRVKKAIEKKAADTLLLKINQIGTLSETIAAAKLSYANGWGVQVSHRSGETEDTFIADMAVGLRTGQLKDGATARSERLSKYNQLLRIERELGPARAIYAGKQFHNGFQL